MRIKIISKEENSRINLWLPTHLILNGVFASVAAPFINAELKKQNINIKFSGKSLRKFVKGFYKIRRHFGGKIDLVDIEDADGSIVKIVL